MSGSKGPRPTVERSPFASGRVGWLGRRDSNPRRPDPESGAVAAGPRPYGAVRSCCVCAGAAGAASPYPWTLQAFGGVRSGGCSPGGSALRDRNQARRLISIPVEGFEADRFPGTASLAPGVMTRSEQHRRAKLKARGGCLWNSGGHGMCLRTMRSCRPGDSEHE